VKAIALLLAIVFFIVAILYGVGVLQIGAHEPGPHVKHAVLFAILGVLSLVWMRFQSNSSAASLR
jgi:ABC-type transport system involved in multi-copper enzyme maturation permease subunit